MHPYPQTRGVTRRLCPVPRSCTLTSMPRCAAGGLGPGHAHVLRHVGQKPADRSAGSARLDLAIAINQHGFQVISWDEGRTVKNEPLLRTTLPTKRDTAVTRN